MDYNVGHATSQPVAEDVVVRSAAQFVDPPFATSLPELSTAEIEHFKTQGFIVKRGLFDNPELFAQVVDQVWKKVPRRIMRRDDPASWTAKPHEQWTEEDAANIGLLVHGNWKMRSRGPAGIGTEPLLVNQIANDPRMRSIAEAFMGGPAKRAERVRGIYCIFPNPPDIPGRYGPHADYMAAHVTAMVIADRIPPNSGGFTVWPGSHLRLHEHWDTVHGGVISPDRAEGYRLARDAILREITPLEFTGDAGDVIFWHPRLLHSAGINESGNSDEPLVRVIVPCDYQRLDRCYFDDLDYGPGPDFQWWIDTRNFHGDVAPTADNMWADWAI